MARVIVEVPREERRATCQDCGHTIGYHRSDLHSHTARDISQVEETYYYIVCPSYGCGRRIYVSEWRTAS